MSPWTGARRPQRHREERKEFYPQLLDLIAHTRAELARFEEHGERQDDLVLLDESARRGLFLQLSSFGSKQVNTLLERFIDTTRDHLRHIERYRYALEWHATPVVLAPLRENVEQTRDAIAHQANELHARMRRELEG